MAVYHYTLPWVVLDPVTGELVKNRADGVLLDKDGNGVVATTELGVPTTIRTGPSGTTGPFLAEVPMGRVQFGTVQAAVFADEQHDAADRAEAAQAAAEATLAEVTRIADTSTEVSYVYRDPAGDLRVSSTPLSLAQGGMPLRVDPTTGDVIATLTA